MAKVQFYTILDRKHELFLDYHNCKPLKFIMKIDFSYFMKRISFERLTISKFFDNKS